MKNEAVIFTSSQQEAFDLYLNGESFYLAGKAGTGKSFLVSQIISDCNKHSRKVLVCAPTGVAAINVQGATLHRVFGVHRSILEPGTSCKSEQRLQTIAAADIIIIDEISMCRIDLYEYVMRTLLAVRKRRKDKKLPQMIFVGDFFQLPPVVTPDEKELFEHFYPSPYAFSSDLWHWQMVELNEVVRQQDANFAQALNNIRVGKADFNLFSPSCPDEDAITICTTNRMVDNLNGGRLSELARKSRAQIYRFAFERKGDVKEGDIYAPKLLDLCVGARVVMLCNDDCTEEHPSMRWVNGSLGTVRCIGRDSITVRIDGEQEDVEVGRYTWKIMDYSLAKKKEKEVIKEEEVGSVTQFPLRLAWAVTVHKSQGQTYERVNVDLTQNFFVEGQLYVALSRCKSLAGMRCLGKASLRSLMTSRVVMDFYENAIKF